MLGCATKEVVKIQYADKYVYVEPPEALMVNCQVDKPPSKEKYLAVPVEERERMLYEYSNILLMSLGICNIQFKELRAWNLKQKKIYSPDKP